MLNVLKVIGVLALTLSACLAFSIAVMFAMALIMPDTLAHLMGYTNG